MTALLDRIRAWVSWRLFQLARVLDPPERGEPCVDCGIPLPDDCAPDECPTCEASQDEERRLSSVYDDGAREAAWQAWVDRFDEESL